MTVHANPTATEADPVERQLSQLHAALVLVQCMAGGEAIGSGDSAELARRYDAALPVARRRFDALAAEIIVVASAGVEALLGHKLRHGTEPQAAAACLAQEIRRGLAAMARLLA